MLERGEFGERTLRFLPVPDFFARLERLGHIPLPPYIDRADTAEDRSATRRFMRAIRGRLRRRRRDCTLPKRYWDSCGSKGVETAAVTLHVGLGTFSPIRTEVVEEHKIHTEWYRIPEETAEKITRAKREGRRVVAVGTTTVRTLEYAAGKGAHDVGNPMIAAHSGEANIFHLSGIPLPGGGCDADEFSSAKEHAADAGVGLCRTRAGDGGIRACGARALPVLQLWGLHVHRVAIRRVRLERSAGLG